MHITRKLAATVAVPAALAISAAGAYAATSSSSPIDSSGVIHGCYSTNAVNGSHTITLQNAGTGCPQGATAVTWNQKGAAGPAGARGPAGAGAPVDYGTITISELLNPSGSGATTTCTGFTASGPDARTATVTALPSGGGCDITGLDGTVASFQLTGTGGAGVSGLQSDAIKLSPPLGTSTYSWAAFLKS